MQIQIIVAQAKAPTKMIVGKHESGLVALNHVVKAGEKITLLMDGVRLTGKEVIGKQKFKLVRVGQSLVVEAQDGGERVVELTDFYDQPGALLTGDQWQLADASQLQQLSEGVAVSTLPVPATLSLVNVAAGQAAGSSVIGNVFGAAVSAATVGGIIDSILNDDTSNPPLTDDTSNPPLTDEQGTGGSLATTVPEAAGGGINAAEAVNGVPVVVTLPTGAAAGDVVTVTIDDGTAETYTLTANDVDISLNPGGTVSVILPQSAIVAAGQGAAVITTTYSVAAGNPATGGSVMTNVNIDTLAPGVPTVTDLPTNDTTPTISGIATLLTGERLTVVVNGATYNNVAVVGGAWSINTGSVAPSSGALGAFVNGQSYEISATVTDAAGNSSSDTSSNEISFDTQSPAAPVLALFLDTGNPTDRQTGNGQIDVSGLEVGSTWQYSLDSGASWQSGNGGFATTGTTGLFIAPAGTYSTNTMLIKQTDAAGNESNESTLDTVIIDGLTGTAAADSLDALAITNSDEQTIFGLADDDSMIGADGDDLFIGGEGDDELRGEGGSDTFLYLNANDGSDLIRSFEIGSGGDKLVFGNWLGSLTLSDDGGNNLKITAGAVSVTLESVSYANAHAMGDAVWLAQMQSNGNLVIL